MDDSGRGRVNVFVRIRPPLPREEGEPSCLTVDEGETNITLQMQDGDAVERVLAGGSFQNSPLEKKFAFDGCFDGESEQKEVFVAVGKPVLRDVISGYNGCILAYGQTGAGKTHSLLNAGGRSPQEAGLLPRTIAALFVHIGSDTQNVYNVEVGTFQLYNEQVDDLLAEAGEGTRGRNLNVVNSGEVQGLTWLPCKTPEELLQAFQRGRNNIVYAETKMNKASSRSHAVFQIKVIKRARATENKGAAVKMKATVGKLTVVDLAGSERVKRSGVSGQQLKEAANINTSLLAFGNVVQALADKKKFIPFRDSKLTRILQDSIGGNSKTSLLVCTSPAAESCSETSSTLEFASRAMRVEITATLNQVDVTVDPSKLAADLAGEGIDKALLEQQRANEAKEKVMEQREARAKKDAEASKALALKAQQDGAKKETEIKELNLKWEKKVEAALLKGAEGKSELETQVKQLKQQLREQEENSEAKLKLLEMQARVGTLEKALQTATSTSAKADAQRDEEYAQQLAALELELQTTHTQWQEDGAARGEAEAKCQRMAAEADAQQQQMDEMKAKFEQETEKLLQQQQAELLAVDARHVEEIEKQICKVRSQYEEAAAAATTAHAAEVKILETEYATELSQLDDLRKHQLMEQELEWKARYVAHEEELQAQLAREKEALGLEKDAEIASLGAKSALQDEAIHELEERKDELHTQLLAAKKAEMEVKLTMEEVVKRLEEESQMVSKKHQSEMEAVRERQAAELQSVTQQADTQQRRTSGLFNSARGVLALKMDVLQASFNSLQERFEQRESRPEDVERIKELETELNTTIEQMRQHHAYSSHLQRQLDNRDENDKVFGGGPAKKAPASLPALKTPKPLGANPMPRRHAGQSVLGSQFKMNR
ncbi:hypothetical protein CYMTET_13751 [Cymbomonas tetramitiformis]|uniref:Kinesin-like protein n=1 Tax=Cymbomonas tetramitiformis TaxID=36881 RepID=A0AAE0LB33_9CHLO|nr:hypothetical protein CYMTET_13751 [Cymbomonas tetramitiformis]